MVPQRATHAANSDASTAVDHIVNMHRAWAMKPYVKPTTILDILGHNGARSTAAEQAALEAAFVAAKSVAPDGTAYESQELDSQFSQDTADVRDAAGHRRRTKTPAQVWAAALMKRPRVSEKEAMAIVSKYPTMMSLMARRDRARRSRMAEAPEGLDCVGTHRGAGSEARRGHQRQGLNVQAEGQRRRGGPGHRAVDGIAREE